MRYTVAGNCLKQIGIYLVMLAIVTSFAVAQTPRKASTVAADSRTGRLVRTTVVVAAKVVEAQVIEPVEVGVPAPPEVSIDELVEQSARNHGVDPLLVRSVIQVESNFNPNAVSNKGAQGLMQLMPTTARDLGVTNPMNPKENIEGGVKYLKYLQNQFNDPALALAAYNAGEGAVRRYGNWIPPYPETQDYVVKVARNYKQAKAAAAAAAVKHPMAAAAPPSTAPTVKTEVPVAAEPPPAPLQYYYDAQGRLTLRTVQ